MRLNFVPTHVFRETPQVSFFDAAFKKKAFFLNAALSAEVMRKKQLNF